MFDGRTRIFSFFFLCYLVEKSKEDPAKKARTWFSVQNSGAVRQEHETTAQRENLRDGHPVDIRGWFERTSRVKNFRQALETREKQACGFWHPRPECSDVHDHGGGQKHFGQKHVVLTVRIVCSLFRPWSNKRCFLNAVFQIRSGPGKPDQRKVSSWTFHRGTKMGEILMNFSFSPLSLVWFAGVTPNQSGVFRLSSASARADGTKMLENSGVLRHVVSIRRGVPLLQAEVRNLNQGRKSSININFLAQISCGHSWPYARMPRGQKVSPHLIRVHA